MSFVRMTPPGRKMFPGGDTKFVLARRRRIENMKLMKFAIMATAILFMLTKLTWSVQLAKCSVSLIPSSSHNKVKVFIGVSEVSQDSNLSMSIAGYTDDHEVLNPVQQRDYLRTASVPFDSLQILERYDQLLPEWPQLAQELWKYCALYEHGGIYLDSMSLLWPSVNTLLSDFPGNVAVESESSFPQTAQGSFLLLREPHSRVAKAMVNFILISPLQKLYTSPFLIPKKLYEIIKSDRNSTWTFLKQQCTKNDDSVRNYCPQGNKYCCKIQNPTNMALVLLTSYPLYPYRIPSASSSHQAHNPADNVQTTPPFISTIHLKVMQPKISTEIKPTPNLYNILKKKDCLPTSKKCMLCLKDQNGATKETCKEQCPCYSNALCNEDVPPKRISHELTVKLPLIPKDPNRLIPRIIHQTWFEDISKDAYPNMIRLTNSWKESGWEYRFYNDTAASRFLEEHFPPVVKEAYDTLIPGAFKADLFRYCVLLIHGGVYADTDVLLESNLNRVIGPQVSFMVPRGELVGREVGKRMCLWNGLMAAAPGHPYLAKAIESAVNHARNRFTAIDVDSTFCPDPELSILHRFDLLFPTGPCLLGASLNEVLGRNKQMEFDLGDLDGSVTQNIFPGKTVILKQNKNDMGAHRFTLLEKHLIVAATDMPGSKDDPVGKRIHYANQTRAEFGIYGLNGLYVDRNIANENIRIVVDQHRP